MRRFVFRTLFFSFFIQCHAFCQDSTLHIKEDYDRYNKLLVDRYKPCLIGTANDHTVFGDGMSHILDGYFTMYETTGDKDYLYRFMTQSICMLENRHDVAGVSTEPRWGDITYEEGYILGAFARGTHFFFIEHPELLSDSLYPFQQFSQNAFNVTFHTVRAYATWLLQQTKVSFDWLIQQGYWNDQLGFLGSPNANQALIINMQVGFARCAFFLGQVTQSGNYIGMANRLGMLCKGQVQFTDPTKKTVYSAPVFQLTKNDAYWWYHMGWRVKPVRAPLFKRNKNTVYGSVTTYMDFIEDMSHGAVVLYMPWMWYRYSKNPPFDSLDMQRFRRTFTYNLNDGSGQFYNAVNGTDGPISDNYCTSCARNYHAMKSLMYASFASFDTIELNDVDVYPLIESYYQKEVAGLSTLPKGYCCGMNKGHAELVEQQWKIGLIELHMGPRLLVYNQLFSVPGTLRIEPEAPDLVPYAEPLNPAKKFEVKAGIKAIFKAEEVHLLPGVEFQAGADVEVKSTSSNGTRK
jgi:hypothetical protein